MFAGIGFIIIGLLLIAFAIGTQWGENKARKFQELGLEIHPTYLKLGMGFVGVLGIIVGIFTIYGVIR